MEVADERCRHAGGDHALLDFRHCRRGFGRVDRHAHHLGASLGELDALAAVLAASAVSVIVIDWTTTGAPPPT